MKRLLIAVTLVVILAVVLWPSGPVSKSGGVLDVVRGMFDRRDSLSYAALEQRRDSLNRVVAAQRDSFDRQRARLVADLALAESAQRTAAGRSSRHRARADSLARALARTRDDDDSLPQLVALVAAKDSVIVAVTEERDAAMGRVSVLERAVEARDSALATYHAALVETMRQRDAYRRFGRRDWLRVGLVMAGTVAVCRVVADPC